MMKVDIYQVSYTASFHNCFVDKFNFTENLIGDQNIEIRIGHTITGKVMPETISTKKILSGVYFDELKCYNDVIPLSVYSVVRMHSNPFSYPTEKETLFYIVAQTPAEVYYIIRNNPELSAIAAPKNPEDFFDVKLYKLDVLY